MALELLVVLLCHPFLHVKTIYNDVRVSVFILCSFLFLVVLSRVFMSFMDLFEALAFCFIILFFFCFSFISSLVYSLSFVYFGFNLLSRFF